LIGPATSPNETETSNHIPAELIALGEKIFGEGVITQLLTGVNSILEKATNLDDRYKLDLKNRIYRMIKQFLEVIKTCLANEESPENKGYLESEVIPTIEQSFVAVAKLMDLPEPYKNLGTKFNDNRLVEVVRDFFNLTGCSDINDQTLLIALYLLNQVKRWRVNAKDYAKSLLKINFEETDLMHVIKIMILAKFLCLEFDLDQENLIILAKLIILHDLPEVVIGDFSQGEKYGDEETFEKIRKLFKEIEDIVPKILLSLLGSQEPWRGLLALYQGYEDRLKPKAEYTELDRVYRILRILDKLDSLVSVMAMAVLDINDPNDLNQYYKQGYSNYLIAAIQSFLLTVEQYAQLLQLMPQFSDENVLTTHLKNLIRKIFELLNQQYNTQLTRADRNSSDPKRNTIIIINWFDLVLNLISNQAPITSQIITEVIQEVIQELNPEDPFDKVISWFGG
jgi:5'-deoxynucleotidase YfbR-like HD superfamily hydrolase